MNYSELKNLNSVIHHKIVHKKEKSVYRFISGMYMFKVDKQLDSCTKNDAE